MTNLNHSKKRSSSVLCAVVVALVGVMHPSVAVAQSWNYQAYNNVDRRPMAPGYITLEERDGKAVFKMYAGQVTNCYRTALNAAVTRTETTTIITPVPALLGCDEVRFVIKNDGTGGQREVKSGSDWIWDGLDRQLTPRK
jgi:hypothetical protein